MAGRLGPKTATRGSAYRSRYGDFVIAMAYGERPEFDVALASVVALAEKTIQQQGAAHAE
jgi:hypothetical protein